MSSFELGNPRHLAFAVTSIISRAKPFRSDFQAQVQIVEPGHSLKAQERTGRRMWLQKRHEGFECKIGKVSNGCGFTVTPNLPP